MEEEGSDTSAATSKRAPIRLADQGLEVERREGDLSRFSAATARGHGTQRCVNGCRQVRFFEGCMHIGDGVTRSYFYESPSGLSQERIRLAAAQWS